MSLNINRYFFQLLESVTSSEETDKIVDAISENAKSINKLLKERQHPNPETLLRHVFSDESISSNNSDHTEIVPDGMNQPEIGTLNADITEMEKIKSVGKCKSVLFQICL